MHILLYMTYVHVYVHMCTVRYVYMYAYVYGAYMHRNAHAMINKSVWIYTQIHTGMFMYMHTQECIYAIHIYDICAYACAIIYVHTSAYTHKYTHTHASV